MAGEDEMVTIKDVAKLAGVSTATVSYVINRSRPVSEERARRVLEAVEALRFAPSRRARGLRKGTTATIGLVIDDVTNRFASQFIAGLESAASSFEYATILSDLQRDPANEERSLTILLEEKVDGIVYAGFGQAESRLVELFAGGSAIVAVDKPPRSRELPAVLIDNAEGVRSIMRHLMGRGHRHILYIAGLKINRNSEIRAGEFERFSREHGLPCVDGSVFYGDYTLNHGYRTTLRLLDEGREVTAIVCGDDLIAFAVIAALKSRGVRVPDDVAVVGFDDDPIAPLFDPSLTTVRYPMREMGEQAFRLLLKYIRGRRKTVQRVVLNTELIVRRSTTAGFRDFHTG